MTDHEILELASTAYAIAGYALLDKHGDHASCGGAWVVISGRGKFAKSAKASSHYMFPHHTKGHALRFGSIPAQSEFIAYGAAQAAVDALKLYGIDARVYSYVD